MLPAHLADNIRTQVLFYLQSTFDFREKSVEAAFERFLTDPENGLFKGPWVQLRRPFRPEAEIHPHRLSNECVIQNHRDSFGPDNVDSTRDSGAERFHTPFRSSTVNVWNMGTMRWCFGGNCRTCVAMTGKCRDLHPLAVAPLQVHIYLAQ